MVNDVVAGAAKLSATVCNCVCKGASTEALAPTTRPEGRESSTRRLQGSYHRNTNPNAPDQRPKWDRPARLPEFIAIYLYEMTGSRNSEAVRDRLSWCVCKGVIAVALTPTHPSNEGIVQHTTPERSYCRSANPNVPDQKA